MPRLSIEQLACDPENDPATAPTTAMVLESTDAQYQLRYDRVSLLRTAAANVDDRAAAGDLRLACSLSRREVHRTIADPLHMHEHRRAVGSQAWRFLEQSSVGKSAVFVTIIQRDAQYQGISYIPFNRNRLKRTPSRSPGAGDA